MVRTGNTVVAAISEHTYSIVTGAIVSLHIKGPGLVSVYYILCGFYDDIKMVGQ